MNKIKKFIELYGISGAILALLYPLTFLLTNPIQLFRSLWNCRILGTGKRWHDYPHFLPRPAINAMFYWTRALNLYKYGRGGRSPFIGLGNYDLSRTFHYSLPSLYLYWKAGAIILLTGMLGWWGTHLLWIQVPGMSTSWILLVMFLTLVSNFFYVNLFAKQNYNVVGWLFVPLIFLGWYTNNWILSSLALFAASFGSMTVVFLMGCLATTLSVVTWSWNPVITMIPAALKLLTHFWPFIYNGKFLETLQSVSKAIGLTPGKSKYVRTEMIKFDIESAYKLILYIQFIIIYLLFNHHISVLYIITVVLWVINKVFARFADEQSLTMLLFSVSVLLMIVSDVHNLFLLGSFWLVISPIFPFGKPLEETHFLVLPVLKPFSIAPLLNDLADFLSPVPSGCKVLMAFDNPNGRYESVMDGYRRIFEVLDYVATSKEIHVLPDWWAIFELNYEGASDFWGRDVESITQNMKQWKTDYVVVYQKEISVLDPKWEEAGFISLNQFSWENYDHSFLPLKPYNEQPPFWWLLSTAKQYS